MTLCFGCRVKPLSAKANFLCVLSFKALEDAFLAIDGRITTEEVIKELIQIAGRPTEEPPSEKMAEEDDCKLAYRQNTLSQLFCLLLPPQVLVLQVCVSFGTDVATSYSIRQVCVRLSCVSLSP